MCNNFVKNTTKTTKDTREQQKKEVCMQKILKKWKFGGVFLGLFLLIAGMMIQISPKEVQAATAGFRKINGKTYYIKANGQKQK